MTTTPESVSPAYRLVMGIGALVIRYWGRLEVTGLDHVPERGPMFVVANHDSDWDGIAGGVAAIRLRQIRALSKASLWNASRWNVWIVGPVLTAMGQIPIERGAADVGALDRAIKELQAGACIGVFPEGSRSRGRHQRARSGLGRLAKAVPEAQIVCCAIQGTTDILRFPRRPQVRVAFFPPTGGGIQAGETPAALSARVLADIRAVAPVPDVKRGPGDRRP